VAASQTAGFPAPGKLVALPPPYRHRRDRGRGAVVSALRTPDGGAARATRPPGRARCGL